MLLFYKNNALRLFYQYSIRCVHLHNADLWPSSKVRRTFIDYFVKQYSYTEVRSSSVRAIDDPDLLFVNAGMNQFKSIFLNNDLNNNTCLKTVVNSQKCVRISGKHNDLVAVGNDDSHHTFFEMLGNWSFYGSLHKADVCRQAWQLLTEVFKLDKNRLYITYFQGDPALNLPEDIETRDIWHKLGIDSSRIFPRDFNENFWTMAKSGPCGSCTEIHYDVNSHQQPSFENSRELWNIVFIEWHMTSSGLLNRLVNTHIDTGLGLERLTAVLNGHPSNYCTDLFQPLIKFLESELNLPPYSNRYGKDDQGGIDHCYRVVSDHIRMVTVALSDGVEFGRQDDGYWTRKILRRAIFELMKTSENNYKHILPNMVPIVATCLGDAYPEIKICQDNVSNKIREQILKFESALQHGRNVFKGWLDDVKSGTSDTVTHEQLYHLHQNLGLPIELIVHLARKNHIDVDLEKFQEMKMKRRKSSMANMTKMKSGF